jgi:transposase
MPKRISIRADLRTDELEQRYRQAHDPVARSQWQIVWLLAQGQTSEEVAETTSYSLTWIRTVARRYNAEGESGIKDRRHANPGGPRLLTREQQAELDRALEGAAPDGGRWTGAKVARWIEDRIGPRQTGPRAGRLVAEETGLRYLRWRDRRPQRPRPRQVKANAKDQEAFKNRRGNSHVLSEA